jgi:two-component system copper resistance phosphate regulon response regulator CusR
MRVLLIDEKSALGAALARRLRSAGIAVDEVANLVDVELDLDLNEYRCLVLNATPDSGSHLELLEHLRQSGRTVPALVVGASDRIRERLEAFEAGADDYIAKPFAIEEFVIRVRALARRAEAGPVRPAVRSIGDLSLDTARREVRRNGQLLPLTPKEYAMLELMSDRAGIVVTRAELVDHCWDEYTDPMSNVVEVHMTALRRKMGDPLLIRTVRGAGYVLDYTEL